jgi:hypothetical protein
MAETNIPPSTYDPAQDEYTWWEVAYWLIGIVMIPGVPIMMIMGLTPYWGIGPVGH